MAFAVFLYGRKKKQNESNEKQLQNSLLRDTLYLQKGTLSLPITTKCGIIMVILTRRRAFGCGPMKVFFIRFIR